MALEYFYQSDEAIICLASESLNRAFRTPRHNYLNRYPDHTLRSLIANAWRFPFIETHPSDPSQNLVTFIHNVFEGPLPKVVSLRGTFIEPFQKIAMKRVSKTKWYSVTLSLPKRQHYRYIFEVDGLLIHDLINPQEVVLVNGSRWSRFFTEFCSELLVLNPWEAKMVQRLIERIMPIGEWPAELDSACGDSDSLTPCQGIVAGIDKILAREEHHRLADYQACLALICQLLKQRFPGVKVESLDDRVYDDLIDELGTNVVADWDVSQYQHPRFFLNLVRRHAVTSAFSHPKYGGNPEGVCWQWLAKHFTDEQGASIFDWAGSLETPLGNDRAYLG